PDGPGPLRISRRTALLGLGGLAMVGVGGWWITDGIPRNEGSSFSSPLAIPPLLPSERVGDERVFRLSAQQGATELVPGVSFATMGFNGAYLGPTISATRGERVRMHVTNRMELPTTAHWHGMILPASQDGTPHQTIIPGATWTAAWRIDQPAATLWYHPHPHGQTELQVGRGLAGLFLVDDPATEARLPAEYGVDDIPLILQDVTVVPGGSQVGTPTQSPIGRIGNTVVVNGTHHARFSATTTLVRFRILNASTARCYNLELSTADPFLLVGTDGGLLATPRSLKSLLLSPAERAEILVRVPKGADIVLRSAPYDLGMSAGDNIDSGAEDHLDILRITGASARGQGHAVPRSLPAVAPPSLTDVVVDRHFTLGDTTINGRTMEMDGDQHLEPRAQLPHPWQPVPRALDERSPAAGQGLRSEGHRVHRTPGSRRADRAVQPIRRRDDALYVSLPPALARGPRDDGPIRHHRRGERTTDEHGPRRGTPPLVALGAPLFCELRRVAVGERHDREHRVHSAVRHVHRAIGDQQVRMSPDATPAVGHGGARVVTHAAGAGLVLPTARSLRTLVRVHPEDSSRTARLEPLGGAV